ncbi:MAG: hypothetical protein ACI4V1_01085 [Eubacteriales bacterium]
MRNFFTLWMAWLLLFPAVMFTGCGKDESGAPPRTMVYRPAFEQLDEKNAIRSSNVVKNGDGYVFAYGYLDTSGETRQSGVAVVHTDTDGNVMQEMPLTDFGDSYSDDLWIGERGIYVKGLYYDEEQEENIRVLFRYSFEGVREAETDITVLRQKGNVNDYPAYGVYLVEREDGIVFLWGRDCIFADDSFTRTSAFELPGSGRAVFPDGDELWIVYSEKDVYTLGRFSVDGTLTESFVLPERFQQSPNSHFASSILAFEDGWLSAWDIEGVFQWKVTAEEKEPAVYDVMDFLDAGIASSYVMDITWIPGEDGGEFAVWEKTALQNSSGTLKLYRPDPTMDLSAIQTLNIVCYQTEPSLTQAVVQFNRSRTDVRMDVIDYSVYNTSDEPSAGYDRMMRDLTTRTVEPDLLYLNPYDFGDILKRTPDYFLDLYPLMDGTVTPDTIYGCVKNALETEDGKLYGISPEFSLSVLVGRRDVIGEAETWSLGEFLDYNDSLADGEYLMEELAQSNFESKLFGWLSYTPFVRDGKADFRNPVFLRRLAFLQTLPTEPETYMDHGSSNIMDLYAGIITEDQVEVNQGGENLYHNGKIKLNQYYLHTPFHYQKAAYEFGTESPADLNFIGYPVDDRCASGVDVRTGLVYTIPAFCRNVGAAWDFVEMRLMLDDYRTYFENTYSQTVDSSYFFKTYQPDYDEYLDALEGYQTFYMYSGERINGRNIELDENGCYKNRPGVLYTFDRAGIDALKRLLDTAGIPLSYRISARGLRSIVEEEESRLLAGAATVESCADAIQSRANIYLSENE